MYIGVSAGSGMAAYIQVSTALDSEKQAQVLADSLVKEGLAACVQVIGPIKSTYVWKKEINRESEWLCLVKSKKALYPELEAEILRLHPYEEPEIVAVPIIAGSRGYLDWIEAQVGDAGDRKSE